ncbi:FHA domain-containing protein [Chamaesiphon sp.]|uniref:FHA domain-containing protein n=1 Tax=Chamaesiphon sp. TaxID=2814140 RepID=UPI0035931C33
MLSTLVLSLLNSIPVQSWTFTSGDVIRIGRATDNQVILFSAVVSRHHAELRWDETSGWQIFNISPNGTYVDGEAISSIKVIDGMTIRLATSGPKIQIKVEVAN